MHQSRIKSFIVFTRTFLWYVVCTNKSLWTTMFHLSYKLNGPLARYAKLRVVHTPGTFSSPSQNSDPDMHHGTCVTHVPWCMPGSPTSGYLWIRWQGKRSRHSPRMPNLQFYASGKRPMQWLFDKLETNKGSKVPATLWWAFYPRIFSFQLHMASKQHLITSI